MTTKKKCHGKCGLEKDLEEFAINRANSDGHEYKCKVCFKGIRADRKKAKSMRAEDGNNAAPARTKNPKAPIPSRIDRAIHLDEQLLKAVKKSVAGEIIRIIEEAFA